MNVPPTAADVAADAPWPSGPLVRPTAWDVMVQAWPGRGLRRSTVRRRRSLVAELATQGWVDAGGRFGEQATKALPAAAGPGSMWRVTGRHRGLASELVVYEADGQCTVRMGPDAATLRSAAGGHAPVRGAELPVAIRTLDALEIPTLLCAWAGVRPGPPAAVQPLELPVPVFTARAHGTAGPPPHEFAQARQVWDDDWFVWDVVTPAGQGHGFIGTAGNGSFAFGQVATAGGPAIRMVPMRSGGIWRILEAARPA